ncbi:hypothetical protein CIB84_011943 [Bambusicola thoracicus]|nr:hypothetical protein CIB84_011943 [Bambusicola thoracicus]
MCRPLR